jgi:murein DD-endopeptidase MepM/ murein hydrolase activator NlpD
MALEPIGFDIPKPTPSTPQTGPATQQFDTTGLQILAQANQQSQQTIENQAKFAQTSLQATSSLATSLVQNAERVAQADITLANSNAQRAASVAANWNNIGEAIQGFAKSQSNKKAGLYAQQKAQAIIALENLRVDQIEQGTLAQEGTAAYRQKLAETMGKYQLAADDIGELTAKYYSPVLDYAKTQEENRQATAEKVSQSRREITANQHVLKLSAVLGDIAASAGLSPTVARQNLDKFDAAQHEVLTNEEVPILDRLFAAKQASDAALKSVNNRSEEWAAIRASSQKTEQMIAYVAEQQGRLERQEINISEYERSLAVYASRLGITGFGSPAADPLAGQRYAYDKLQLTDNAAKTAESIQQRAIGNIPEDHETAIALAAQFQLDPRSYEQASLDDPDLQDGNMKAAIDRYRRFRKWETEDVPKYNDFVALRTIDIAKTNEDFAKWDAAVRQQNATAAQLPSFSKVLEIARFQDPSLAAISAQKTPITPAQYQRIAEAYQVQTNGIHERINAAQHDFARTQQEFAAQGLYLDRNLTRKVYDDRKAHLQRYQEARKAALQSPYATEQGQPGASPNFRGGAPGSPAVWKPLSRQVYNGANMTVPFPLGTVVPPIGSGMDFTASRPGGRQHRGLDFAVEIGTPTSSLVYGVVKTANVTGGYGNRVEIVGDDGYTYHYAHLDSFAVVPGQRVAPGQVIARTGNTGVGSGPHLHFDIMDPNGKVIDPTPFLATRQFGNAGNTRQPRTAGSSMPGGARPVIPLESVTLDGSTYIHKGNVEKVRYPQTSTPVGSPKSKGSIYQKPAQYKAFDPVVRSRAPGTVKVGTKAGGSKAYGGDDSWGYTPLSNNREFAQAVNRVAAKHGIPGSWLADIMAYETGNTFNPAEANGSGHYGLIQFGPGAREDLGVSVDQLVRMTPVQQMVLVDKYLTLQKRYAGIADSFRNVGEFVAAINQGHTVLRDVRNRGNAAINDPSNRDGNLTLRRYIETLGKYSGRKYSSSADRADRIRPVHENVTAGCPMCQQMEVAGFFPHEGYGDFTSRILA